MLQVEQLHADIIKSHNDNKNTNNNNNNSNNRNACQHQLCFGRGTG